MSLALIGLALFIFLQSAVYLAWFAVDATLLGVVGLTTAILLFVEGGPVVYNKYVVRKP